MSPPSARRLHSAVLLLVVLVTPGPGVRADIYRWDTGEVISGTEGITPGPYVEVVERDLEFADLQRMNLFGSTFYHSNLDSALLNDSNLAFAELESCTLTNASLAGAIETGTSFIDTTSRGFTSEQLYSSGSYQQKDLQGIQFSDNDVTRWDFPLAFRGEFASWELTPPNALAHPRISDLS